MRALLILVLCGCNGGGGGSADANASLDGEIDQGVVDAAPDAEGDLPLLIDEGVDAEVARDEGMVEPDEGMVEPDEGMIEADQGLPPPGCEAFDGLTDETLVAALHTQTQAAYAPIEPMEDLGGNLNRYTTGRHAMFTIAERIEVGGELGVETIYTGRFQALGPDEEPDHGVINAEHTWPRARMEADEESALFSHEESDIHNLFPADSEANSTRGSEHFGDPIRGIERDFEPALHGMDAEGRNVWAPRPERKGDVARTIFYFSVRWGREIVPHEQATLRTWHAMDPVDARERRRNDLIEGIQGNRNPFVDCPDTVDRVSQFGSFDTADGPLPLP